MLKWLKKITGRSKTSLPLCSVVVPAAGNAARMEGIDKVMAPLDGLPVLIRTLRCLERSPLIREIIVVTREDLLVPVSQLCKDFMLRKVTKVIVGGEERIHSVQAGLREVRPDAELIAIHDGARPLLRQEVLEGAILMAQRTGAAAPAIPLTDTVKRVEGGQAVQTLDRNELCAIQTPQVFEAGLIKGAIEKAVASGESLTDDCAAVERLGMKVTLTPGDPCNRKITTPLDLVLGEAIVAEWGE